LSAEAAVAIAANARAPSPPSKRRAPLLNLAGTLADSIVDGPGLRFVVFAQGCAFNCPGCHNPQTHAFGIGADRRPEEVFAEIRRNPLARGVTFSGGDPFFQAEAFAALAALLKGVGYEVAAFTGFTWEELARSGSAAQHQLLSRLDVLVDARFEIAQRDLGLRFRGSANQRVIDVQASLEAQKKTGSIEPVLCAAKRWAG
jgi:anaerobic ribonucleoside-triphosphate reductase activating protein